MNPTDGHRRRKMLWFDQSSVVSASCWMRTDTSSWPVCDLTLFYLFLCVSVTLCCHSMCVLLLLFSAAAHRLCPHVFSLNIKMFAFVMLCCQTSASVRSPSTTRTKPTPSVGRWSTWRLRWWIGGGTRRAPTGGRTACSWWAATVFAPNLIFSQSMILDLP